MIAYISGPMRGLPNYNFDAFNLVASDLRERGFQVLNPAENFGGDTTLAWETYMRQDVEDVIGADFVVVLPGWENSVGAKIEVTLATSIGTPVYDYATYIACYDLEVDPQPIDLAWLLTPAGKREAQPTKRSEQETVLQTANRIVFGKRQQDYGRPHVDFSRTAAYWSNLFGVEVRPEQVSLAMILLKISRLMQTPDHYDSVVDLAGYAGTYDLVMQDVEKLKENDGIDAA